jgi:hypothetical protein
LRPWSPLLLFSNHIGGPKYFSFVHFNCHSLSVPECHFYSRSRASNESKEIKEMRDVVLACCLWYNVDVARARATDFQRNPLFFVCFVDASVYVSIDRCVNEEKDGSYLLRLFLS